MAAAQRERQVLLKEVSELRADKKDAAARDLRAQEKEKAMRASVERMRAEHELQVVTPHLERSDRV